MDLRTLADRYLEPGLDLRRARSTLRWLREELATAAKRNGRPAVARLVGLDLQALVTADAPAAAPSLDQFAAEVDPAGDFGESELVALYRERYPEVGQDRRTRRNTQLVARQLTALAWIEQLVATDPVPDDPVDAWLPQPLAGRLMAVGLTTLGGLAACMNRRGRLWWRSVPKVGPRAAGRVAAWFERHAPTLGVRLAPRALQPYRQLAAALRAQPVRPTTDIVPLERLAVPDQLSGRQGSNRGTPGRCRLAADNDFDAIHAWLRTKAANPNTFRAYRKEAERLLLWAVVQKGRGVSSLTIEDCAEYRDFLADPQPSARWVGSRNVERFSPAWKPFDGPLSERSRKHAVTVLKSMFEWLMRAHYLDSNPWDGVPAVASMPRRQPGEFGQGRTHDDRTGAVPGRIDTDVLLEAQPMAERHLTLAQWRLVQRHLASLHPNEQSARLRFAVLLAYATGLRASELVDARTGRIQRRAVGEEGEEIVRLRVLGKGAKPRWVPLAPPVIASLVEYLAERGLPADPAHCDPATPLLARLSRAVGQGAGTAEAARPLTTAAIYRMFKQFFLEVSRELERRGLLEDAAQLARASTHWLRHTFGSHAAADQVPLPVIQGVLGHASLATTTLYSQAEAETAYREVGRFVSKRLGFGSSGK